MQDFKNSSKINLSSVNKSINLETIFFIIRKNYTFNIIFSFHSIELARLRIEWWSILTYVSKAWHEVFAWKLSVIYQVEATRNHSSKTSMFTYQGNSMCTYIFPTLSSTPNLEKRIVYPFPMLFVVRNIILEIAFTIIIQVVQRSG